MYRKSILCGMLLLFLGCNKDGGIGKGRSSDGEAPQVFALLKVESRQPTMLSTDGMRAADLDKFNLYKRSQQVLVTSDVVILAALRMNDVSQLPMLQSHGDRKVRWLSQQLQVDFPNDADIMRIGMSGENFEEMVRLVDAIVDAYLREVVDAERANQLRRRDQLWLSREKHLERAWKKALEIDRLEKHLRDQSSETADAEDKLRGIMETPELQIARRELAELGRISERLGEEYSILVGSVNVPARVLLLQRASE